MQLNYSGGVMGSGELPDWNDVFLTAALEPERWLEALDIMARHTGAAHGQLIGVGGARDVPFNLVTNFDSSALQKFIDIGGGSPELNFRIAASVRHIERGQFDPLLYERHYDDEMGTLSSARYVEFCEEVDIPFGCQTNLVLDGVGLIGLATLRKRKEGRTTSPQRRVFAQAAVAARRAVRLQERMEGEQAKFLAGAFEAIGVTAFILDARGQVLALSESAEEYLVRGDIRMSKKTLGADGTPFSLRQAIDALISDDGLPHVRLRVDFPVEKPPLFLEGFRLPARPWSLGKLPQAILIANAPRRDRAGIAAFLTTLYGMTPAEADIAMRLYDGKSRSEIAVERSVTAETLRGQIKSLYAKAAVDNEAALMRLLAAVMS